MFCTKLLIFLYFLHVCYCDWVAEWMSPVQEQLRQRAAASRRLMDDEVVKMVQVTQDSPEVPAIISNARVDAQPALNLKIKLEDTLTNAEDLIDKLQMQIAIVQRKEQMLKEAITNGRSGVSAVTVSTLHQPPRTYIIREGAWVLCNGMVQYPTGVTNGPNLFNELFATPRCIGQEVVAKQDPCVFNSIIKYEVVPERRKLEYTEENIVCLRPAFNKTLEQFRSVPRHVINSTCKDGVVRPILDNIQSCGLRILSDYTYYPYRSTSASLLPLEYCTEKDGSCKLIVAWHLSAALVENFQFFKSEDVFNKMFMKHATDSAVDHIL